MLCFNTTVRTVLKYRSWNTISKLSSPILPEEGSMQNFNWYQQEFSCMWQCFIAMRAIHTTTKKKSHLFAIWVSQLQAFRRFNSTILHLARAILSILIKIWSSKLYWLYTISFSTEKPLNIQYTMTSCFFNDYRKFTFIYASLLVVQKDIHIL